MSYGALQLELGQCTAQESGQPPFQWLWPCNTCGGKNVCFSCASECHAKHILSPKVYVKENCGCASLGKCKKLKKPTTDLKRETIAGLWQGACLAGVPGYAKEEKQLSYTCKQCKVHVCVSCLRCHAGHELKADGVAKLECACSKKVFCLARCPNISKSTFSFSMDPPKDMLDRVNGAISAGQCTHVETGPCWFVPQLAFECKTCNLVGDQSVCVSCVQDCHAKHEIVGVYRDRPSRCFCGNNQGRCKRFSPTVKPMVISAVMKCYQNMVCTYEHTGTDLVNQTLWGCETCNIGKGYGVCVICIVKCHSGHQIKPIGVSETKTFCDCPSKGSCKSCSVEGNISVAKAAPSSQPIKQAMAQISSSAPISRISAHIVPNKIATANHSSSLSTIVTAPHRPATTHLTAQSAPASPAPSHSSKAKKEEEIHVSHSTPSDIPLQHGAGTVPLSFSSAVLSSIPSMTSTGSSPSIISAFGHAPKRSSNPTDLGDIIHRAQSSKLPLDKVTEWEQTALTRFQCTYTPADYAPLQSLFECLTCELKGKHGVCISCILCCHKNHKIGNRINGFPCQCSIATDNCQCLEKREFEVPPVSQNILTAYRLSYCTFDVTYKEHSPQPWFNCITCKLTGNKVLCLTCIRCHAGHEVEPAKHGDSGFCYCPITPGMCKASVTSQPVVVASRASILGQCSVMQMGLNHISQASFICRTCESKGLNPEACISCCLTCHLGHEIEAWRLAKTSCKCDRATCIATTPTLPTVNMEILPNFWRGSCTGLSTSPEAPGAQPFFICKTCPMPRGVPNLECCLSCVSICHTGHTIVPLGMKTGHCVCTDYAKCAAFPRNERCPDEIAGYCRAWNVRYQKVCAYQHKFEPGISVLSAPKPTRNLLDGGSAAFLRVKKYFLNTWQYEKKDPEILNIYQLDCPGLKDYFEKMKDSKGQAVVEAFHGTNVELISKILREGLVPPADYEGHPSCIEGKSRVGATSFCDVRCSSCTSVFHEWNRCHMFGLGVYFAVNSSKSDSYVKCPPNQSKYMLVCNLLVGQQDVTKSLDKASSFHNRVKPLAGDSIYVRGVGDQAKSGLEVMWDEIVIFHPHQILPTYLIEYKIL